MTEYHVIYITIAPTDDRLAVTEMMDHECDRQAAGGWRLVSAVADTVGGSTAGIWLYFSSEDSGIDGGASEVALAEEMVSEDAGRSSARGAPPRPDDAP